MLFFSSLHSIQPEFVQALGSTLTILSLVNAGMGLALVPRSASAIRFEQVRFRELPLPSGVCGELHLVWRDDNDNPALPSMIAAVRQAARDIYPQN
ncbi:LysR substrate binding domain-containing protein [Pseudomonas sihuiensis]|uniref:LysR substrate binding domain-containing protein n=1 Tax=Pseudomonas sihuiensis TaxID=1274359 RepID=A0A1H2NFQ4_9PSED|nr:LysR substrate binding domain-containing protein [Pseudomonas sihuiensis]